MAMDNPNLLIGCVAMYKDARSRETVQVFGDVYLTGTVVKDRILAKYVKSNMVAGWLPFNANNIFVCVPLSAIKGVAKVYV